MAVKMNSLTQRKLTQDYKNMIENVIKEQPQGAVKGVPGHRRGFGTRCSLRSLPRQAIL